MFFIVRIAVVLFSALLLLVISGKLRKRFFRLNLRKKAVCALFLIITIVFSFAVPLETYSLSFSTPEEAFRYQFLDKTIVEKIETENGAFIIYEDGIFDRYTYVNKREGRWYCKTPFVKTSREWIGIKNYENSFSITSILGENRERLVLIEFYPKYISKDAVKIEDNINSNFAYLCKEGRYTEHYFFTVVSGYAEGYKLTVDDMVASWDGQEWYSDADRKNAKEDIREVMGNRYIVNDPLYQIVELSTEEEQAGPYFYRIGTSEKIFAEDVKQGTAPQIDSVGSGIIRLFMDSGTDTFSVQYFDVLQNRTSETVFPHSVYADYVDAKTNECLVAYFDVPHASGKNVLRIRDVFNAQGFSIEIDREFISVTCNQLILLNENEIYLDYDVLADEYSNDDLATGKSIEFKNIREVVKFR